MRRSIVLDVVTVATFVAIGRSAHDKGLTLGGFDSTAWPFAIGLAAGWLLAERCRGQVSSPYAGGVVVVATVVVGMALRVLSGQGTAVAFVLVAVAFLGLGMVGWRLVYRAVADHR